MSECVEQRLAVQWNLIYNEVFGTMTISLLYQVSHYIRVKKPKKYKEVGPAELPSYKRVLFNINIRPLYNEVPLYYVDPYWTLPHLDLASRGFNVVPLVSVLQTWSLQTSVFKWYNFPLFGIGSNPRA